MENTVTHILTELFGAKRTLPSLETEAGGEQLTVTWHTEAKWQVWALCDSANYWLARRSEPWISLAASKAFALSRRRKDMRAYKRLIAGAAVADQRARAQMVSQGTPALQSS